MFGIFKSRLERAADAIECFFRQNLVSAGPLPSAALLDKYCIGFLHGVGMHVANQSLQNGSAPDARAAFELALVRVAPNRAQEALESLPFLNRDTEFLRSGKDAETYFNWTVLHAVSEREGQAAFDRFLSRLREVANPTEPRAPISTSSPGRRGGQRSSPSGGVSWTDWQAEDAPDTPELEAKQEIRRTYTISGMRAAENTATLTIVCALGVSLMPDGQSVSLDRQLRFHLRPFRLPHEADFIMRLVSRDEKHGGEFDIVAAPEKPGSDIAIIAEYGGRNDVATCVTTLRLGEDMIFKLRDQREGLVDFLLPNDASFKTVYDETIERLQQRAVANDIIRYNIELQRQAKIESKPHEPLRLRGDQWKSVGSGHEYRLLRDYTSANDKGVCLRFECVVKSSKEVNSVESHLLLRLKPFRRKHKGSLVVGLFTAEPKGALVEVEVTIIPEESQNDLLDVLMWVHKDDAHKTLRALAAGDELQFALMAPAPPDQKPYLNDTSECYARFTLENDGDFKKLYDETVEKVSVCQDATRARQLSELWYRRRTPGVDAG
jgi:hypothetical protein